MARDVAVEQGRLAVEADDVAVDHMAEDRVAVLELVGLVQVFDVVLDAVGLLDDASAARVGFVAVHIVGHEAGAVVGADDLGDAHVGGDGHRDADLVDPDQIVSCNDRSHHVSDAFAEQVLANTAFLFGDAVGERVGGLVCVR